MPEKMDYARSGDLEKRKKTRWVVFSSRYAWFLLLLPIVVLLVTEMVTCMARHG